MRSLLCILPLVCVVLGPILAEDNPQVRIQTSLGDIRAELFVKEAPLTVANFIGLAEGSKPWSIVDRQNPASSATLSTATATGSFYAGKIFHRVIPNFMIQAGCPYGDGTGSPVAPFADEINPVNLGLEATVIQGQGVHPYARGLEPKFFQYFLQPELEKQGLGPETSQDVKQRAVMDLLPSFKAVTLLDFFKKIGYVYQDTLPPSHAPVRGSLAMANSGPNTNGSQFFINVGDTPHLRGKHTVFGRVTEGQSVVDAISQVRTAGQNNKPVVPVVIIRISVLR